MTPLTFIGPQASWQNRSSQAINDDAASQMKAMKKKMDLVQQNPVDNPPYPFNDQVNHKGK